MKFSPAGASTGSLSLGYTVCKIAVDQTNNDLFSSTTATGEITKYTAASGYTTTLGFGNVGTSNAGIAINGLQDRSTSPPTAARR